MLKMPRGHVFHGKQGKCERARSSFLLPKGLGYANNTGAGRAGVAGEHVDAKTAVWHEHASALGDRLPDQTHRREIAQGPWHEDKIDL